MDEAAEVLVALGDRGVELLEVAVDRAEAAEDAAEILAAVLEALAGADEDRAQVRLVVVVERLEDLVERHVRRRVRQRHRVALLDLAARRAARARVEREEHVAEARERAHQDRRVFVDRQVLAVHVEGDDRAAVDQLDIRDVADPDACDPQRLTLAGDDALGVVELGLELEGLLLQHRDPEALLLEDVVADPSGEDYQGDDRDEVAEVLADRGHHRSVSSSFIIGRRYSMSNVSARAALSSSRASS